MKNADLLWYRLGDNGEYYNVGNTLNALANVLHEAEVKWDFDHLPGKIYCEKWRDWNYISVYWGDDDAQMWRGLDNQEVKVLRDILRRKQ